MLLSALTVIGTLHLGYSAGLARPADPVRREREMSGESRQRANRRTYRREEKVYVATQWQLMWWRFRKHKAGHDQQRGGHPAYTWSRSFASSWRPMTRRSTTSNIPMPRRSRSTSWSDAGFLLRPFVYGLKRVRDPLTWQIIYKRIRPVPDFTFLCTASRTSSGACFPDRHPPVWRDRAEERRSLSLARIGWGATCCRACIYGTRISLSIGLVGVLLSLSWAS